MARENKQKRNARRFGTFRRLADRILAPHPSVMWVPPFYVKESDWEELYQLILYYQKSVSGLKVFEISNIEKYLASLASEKDLDSSIIGQVSIPYERCFIEHTDGDHSFGCLFTYHTIDELSVDVGMENSVVDWAKTHEGSHAIITMSWAVYFKNRDFIIPSFNTYVCLNKDREIVSNVEISAVGKFRIDKRMIEEKQDLLENMGQSANWASLVTLYALYMMDAKGIKVSEINHGREFDRERKKAGLKPFVRYNVITIDPNRKQYAGTATGQGGSVAQHTCRGHVKTFTAEKPLFGKYVGKFWVPAHVKGDPSKGIVLSDYEIK